MKKGQRGFGEVDVGPGLPGTNAALKMPRTFSSELMIESEDSSYAVSSCCTDTRLRINDVCVFPYFCWM